MRTPLFLTPLSLPLPQHPTPFKRRPRITLSHTLEPSFPYQTPTPPNISGTTIYHTIPSTPKHLSPPTQKPDGDAYILAISFPNSSTNPLWLRGRFLRTRPYFRELRAAKRLYKGLYGSVPDKGPRAKAPLKPKANPTTGLFTRSGARRGNLVAYGPRALPVQVSLDTLVTRGYTAVGNVLTEGELVETRGTEILAHDGDLFLTLARNAAGAALYVFVTEGVGEGVRRYDRVQAEGCVYGDVAVRDEFIVVVLWRVKERFLGGLFARGGVEDVDLSYGTRVIVYQQGGGILSDAVVPGVIMTNVTDVSESEGKFRVSGIAVAEECSLADIWMSRVSPLQRQGLVEIVDAEVEWVDESVVAPVSGCLRSLYMQSDDGRAGIARLENGRRDVWYAGAVTLSGACVSPCGGYVSAIETSGAGGRFVVLDAGDLEGGVVSEVGLGEFGEVGVSAGGVWEDVECEWSEEGSRVVKSAYELFDEKNWNDIESGFSSLGLG